LKVTELGLFDSGVIVKEVIVVCPAVTVADTPLAGREKSGITTLTKVDVDRLP